MNYNTDEKATKQFVNKINAFAPVSNSSMKFSKHFVGYGYVSGRKL
jgi:hypothetical protein